MLWLAISLCIVEVGSAQKKEAKIPKTNTIDQYSTINKKKTGPKVKKTTQIIKTNTRGILYGNLCFEDYIKSKGYEYVIQPEGDGSFKSKFKTGWHNFGAKFIVVLKNGIFWRVAEKKRIRECRIKTGDRIG